MRGRKKVFKEAGLGQGSRPELIGGGLVRSRGGWSQALSKRRRSAPEKSEERILGSGEGAKKQVEETIRTICEEEGIRETELKDGSRLA
ncbi:MAG: hypothetical protein FIA94_10760 [Nitrospirae bacterium]|nr:hypothetical protein [Nitrospirota bacterium]